MLGATGGHDDHGDAEVVLADCLGYGPAIESGQHQIDDGHVGARMAQAAQSALAVLGEVHVEAGMAEMHHHRLAQDRVVLDDQDARHGCTVRRAGGPVGCSVAHRW